MAVRLTKEELEELARLVAKQLPQAPRPEPRAGLHSSNVDLVRAQSDSKQEFDERAMAFERFMRGVVDGFRTDVDRLEKKVDVAAKSIPPATEAAKGAEVAAVAGKTSALAAKISSKRALIVVLLQTGIVAVWEAIQFIAAHSGRQ